MKEVKGEVIEDELAELEHKVVAKDIDIDIDAETDDE
jgi:hypothetical protein